MGLSTILSNSVDAAAERSRGPRFSRIANTWRALSVLSAVFVAACAGVPVHEALPDGARDKFTSTDVVIPVRQNEIYVYVPPSNVSAATGGGLIAALVDVTVDSVRASKAEGAVKTLRDSLVDFDFDKALQADLKASLGQKSWMRIRDVQVMKEVTGGRMDRTLADSTADAVLFTTADYRLSNDGDVLSIRLDASLFPRSDALRAFEKQASEERTNLKNALYHSKLTFQVAPPNMTDDRARNMPMWSAKNGALMRSALTLGAAKLSQMLAADLEQQAQAGSASSTDAAFTIRNELDAPENLKGRSIGTDADGTMYRDNDGSLYYLASGFASSLAAN